MVIKPIIEIKNVIKEYRGVKALDSVSLDINSGEFVSIVGPSGAGKSTLIKLLICEEKLTSGSIKIAGREITQLKRTELPYYRRKVGVVYQDFKLLPKKTVYENVAFALEVCDVAPEEVEKRVMKVLKLVGLETQASRYVDDLSGGEKQRVSIARALVHAPKLLIADEPTGNLDPKNSLEIAQLLQKINETGTIVLLATHDKAVVDSIKRRVVTVQDGKIISDQLFGNYSL